MFRKERRPSAHPHNNPQSQDGASCEEPAEPTTKKRFSLIRAFSKLSRSSSFQNLPKFSMGVGGGEQDQDKTNNTTPGIFSKFFKRDNGGEEGSCSSASAAASRKRKSLWQRSKSILKAATTATFSKSTSLSKSGADLEDGESVCSGPMNKYRLIGSGLMTRIEFNTTSVNETTLDTDGVLLKLLESNREAYEMLKERKRLEAAAGKETNDQLIIEESPAVNNSGVLNDDYAAAYQEIDGEHFFFQDNIQLDSPLLSTTDNESSSCIISESELGPLISYESSVYTSEEEDNNVEVAVGHTLEEMTQMFDILGIGEPERFPDGSLRYVLEPEVSEDCEDNDHDNENGNDEGGEGVKDKVVEIIEFKQWKDEVTESEAEVKEAAEPLKMTVGRNAKSADTFTSIQLNEIAPNPNSSLMKKTRSFSHSVTAATAAATTKRPSTTAANGENNLNLDRRHSMGEQVAKIVAMFEGI